MSAPDLARAVDEQPTGLVATPPLAERERRAHTRVGRAGDDVSTVRSRGHACASPRPELARAAQPAASRTPLSASRPSSMTRGVPAAHPSAAPTRPARSSGLERRGMRGAGEEPPLRGQQRSDLSHERLEVVGEAPRSPTRPVAVRRRVQERRRRRADRAVLRGPRTASRRRRASGSGRSTRPAREAFRRAHATAGREASTWTTRAPARARTRLTRPV